MTGSTAASKLTKTAQAPVVEDNVLLGNLYGIDIHGAKDSIVRRNRIEGRQDRRMNDARQWRLCLERAGCAWLKRTISAMAVTGSL